MPLTTARLHCRLFITGGSGYLGRHLVPQLQQRGHAVRALVRPGAQGRLPAGCETVVGDALRANSFGACVPPADTFVHLVGVPRPGPAKARLFRTVDLASVQAAVTAACTSGIAHLVYVSVAQPAPVMQAYVRVRAECEALIRGSGLNATLIRPWYVLGPGHRWPHLLQPFYWLGERWSATRDTARRLGLVTLTQMIAALVHAVEHPPTGIRVMEVPEIRKMTL
ncbi:MAG: NAD(P)H-binding protein [candidate division KSB1 bacterium]|nr:NAD(P)H-binding protein [candidate division KSB1 bacterium]MDZ7275324.1 NAD(P)H-binding protein [candidate division KSB1 bacterium]MDZ7287491.1 NAD(P)H-binding protein [candidate division KSB1 bacterium]MDZ7299605.1 NAD(P)H-binding protein [candidate division KSB1 bacterium]MDZ7307457.1 NAD(P)H-binding protein [candidate division KSB1 bacterium]